MPRCPRSLLVSLALLATGIMLTAGCDSQDSTASVTNDEESAEVQRIPIETLAVRPHTFRQTFRVPATAQAHRDVQISVEAPGRITSAPFDDGETVERGNILINVDSEDEKAQIDLLENQLESAKREYARTKRMAEQDLATEQDLDQAETALENARLNLRQARVGLGKSATRTPLTGRVAEKFVEVGEYISPGQPVARVVDASTVEIVATVPESKIGAVKEGQTVDVRFPALQKSFEAEVAVRPSEVTAATRTYPVEIRVDNENGEILPGMRCEVTFVHKVWENALVIPREAVLQGFHRQEVAVLSSSDTSKSDEDDAESPGQSATTDGAAAKPVDQIGRTGRAAIRTVDLGPGSGNRVVVEEGLESGDRLIVRGHRGLVKDTPLRVVNAYESLEQAVNPFGTIGN